MYLTANPKSHGRSKHFEIDYHYVRERVALGALVVKHVPSSQQLADIFTKSLPQVPFTRLRTKLGVTIPPTPSLRGAVNEMDQVKQTSIKQVWKPKEIVITKPITKSKPTQEAKPEQRSSPLLQDKSREHAVHTEKTSWMIDTSNRYDALAEEEMMTPV